MKASANEEPERLVVGDGKAQFNYNIKQVTVEEQDGSTRTAYEYEYVEIVGKLTKAKIIKALNDSKLETEEEYEASEIEAAYNAAKTAITESALTNLTYAQLNTYINNNVTDLASIKAYLKKLSKVVLAIIKYINAK